MQARSFSYHLLSARERFTTFCVAAALTIAGVAWSSVMIDRVRFLPENTVYLFLTPPHRSFLEVFHNHWPRYWYPGGPAFPRNRDFVASTPMTSSVNAECTLDEAGWAADCRATGRIYDDRLVDLALRYLAQARHPLARAGRGAPITARTTVQVVFDSESELERRSGPPLVYPSEMRASNRPGWADIQCDIDEAGRANGCSVLHNSGAAFAQSALSYAAEGIYNTATIKEPNVIHLRHRFHVEFRPDD